ncbi:hypothetical protein BLOT_002243 [Blomia tropicalis]|nr:hypothetical protein BLOT_002243 [Blomia tropicalis]
MTIANVVQSANIHLQRPRSLWIIQAKVQFQIAGINNQTTQYNHIISRLPKNVMLMCRDIVKVVPYKKGQLELLKQALGNRYTLSAEKRVKEVLDNIQQLPGELPSVFFINNERSSLLPDESYIPKPAINVMMNI